jgi:hypothetical protein
MKRNRPVLWYDKNGTPKSEPFQITLSQLVRDLIEVDQRQTGVSEVEVRKRENFRAALASKDERSAFALACSIKTDNLTWLPKVLPGITEKGRFLRKISDALDALEGKGKFGPKDSSLNIVTSYYAAVDHLHDIHFGKDEGLIESGEEDPTIPTLAEVKEQFIQLFGERLLPADWTIRKTLKRMGIPLRAGQRGRPKKLARKKRG